MSRTLRSALEVEINVRVTVEGDQPVEAIRDLHEWLVQERELRGAVRLEERPGPEGTLGPVAEAIQILAGEGGVAASVATVVVAWLERGRRRITVKVSRSDGETVEVSGAGRIEDAEELAARLKELLGPDDERA